MKPQLQSLEWIVPKIQREFSRNNNKRVSAVFRYCRNHPHLSLIGDYPILSTIIHTILSLEINLTRKEIWRSFQYSDELKSLSKKEKSQVLDELLTIPSGGMKKTKHASSRKVFQSYDRLPIQLSLY